MPRPGGRPAALKVRLRRADDGRDRIVEFSAEAVPGPDGQPVALHGVMRDLTEEETLKQRLIESEAQYRALAEASPDAGDHRVCGVAAVAVAVGEGALSVGPTGRTVQRRQHFPLCPGWRGDWRR